MSKLKKTKKKLIFFSSKNHKCLYFRFYLKITKPTYLYLMVDLILYITHLYFTVTKTKRLDEHSPQAFAVSIQYIH